MTVFSEARRAAMSRAAKSRHRHGHRPKASKGRSAVLISSREIEGVTWELYDLKHDEPSDNHIDKGGDWSAHKLIAVPGRQGKANFWFGYNYAEARLTKSSEVLALLENEPEVYAWVLATIDPETYGGMI